MSVPTESSTPQYPTGGSAYQVNSLQQPASYGGLAQALSAVPQPGYNYDYAAYQQQYYAAYGCYPQVPQAYPYPYGQVSATPMVVPNQTAVINPVATAAAMPSTSTAAPQNEASVSESDEDSTVVKKSKKAENALPLWGSDKTMNLNAMVLTNIKNSLYFKVTLFALKTYHEVIDEIYNQVSHLEPWERGSRRAGGQTGMCGSVRGVGAGGIVSTAFCILYKLFTLKLTRKQLNGLLKHKDSPYIRAIGFLYLRYTQPPEDLWHWFEPFLEDEEELDVRAGGGQLMTIGQVLRKMLTQLDWFATLFPRIPVNVQKQIEKNLKTHDDKVRTERGYEDGEVDEPEEKHDEDRSRSSERRVDEKRRHRSRSRDRSPHRGSGGRRDDPKRRDYKSDRPRSRDRHSSKREKSRSRSRNRDRKRHDRSERDSRERSSHHRHHSRHH